MAINNAALIMKQRMRTRVSHLHHLPFILIASKGHYGPHVEVMVLAAHRKRGNLAEPSWPGGARGYGRTADEGVPEGAEERGTGRHDGGGKEPDGSPQQQVRQSLPPPLSLYMHVCLPLSLLHHPYQYHYHKPMFVHCRIKAFSGVLSLSDVYMRYPASSRFLTLLLHLVLYFDFYTYKLWAAPLLLWLSRWWLFICIKSTHATCPN